MNKGDPRDRDFQKRAAAHAEKARAMTIKKLVERHVAQHGEEPSDDQIAAVLACSVAKIRRYRQALGR